MGNSDDDILKQMGIAPPKYDFSQLSMKEFERCIDDHCVPLDEKMDTIMLYTLRGRSHPTLRTVFNYDFVHYAMHRAVSHCVGMHTDPVRSKAKEIVRTAYLDPTHDDLYAHVKNVATLVTRQSRDPRD